MASRYQSLFQSTRPLRGATRPALVCSFLYPYFNPRAPCGARLAALGLDPEDVEFQSTRPLRGATADKLVSKYTQKFQSTRPLRGATRCAGRWAVRSRNFNPRAPCGARRFTMLAP